MMTQNQGNKQNRLLVELPHCLVSIFLHMVHPGLQRDHSWGCKSPMGGQCLVVHKWMLEVPMKPLEPSTLALAYLRENILLIWSFIRCCIVDLYVGDLDFTLPALVHN